MKLKCKIGLKLGLVTLVMGLLTAVATGTAYKTFSEFETQTHKMKSVTVPGLQAKFDLVGLVSDTSNAFIELFLAPDIETLNLAEGAVAKNLRTIESAALAFDRDTQAEMGPSIAALKTQLSEIAVHRRTQFERIVEINGDLTILKSRLKELGDGLAAHIEVTFDKVWDALAEASSHLDQIVSTAIEEDFLTVQNGLKLRADLAMSVGFLSAMSVAQQNDAFQLYQLTAQAALQRVEVQISQLKTDPDFAKIEEEIAEGLETLRLGLSAPRGSNLDGLIDVFNDTSTLLDEVMTKKLNELETASRDIDGALQRLRSVIFGQVELVEDLSEIQYFSAAILPAAIEAAELNDLSKSPEVQQRLASAAANLRSVAGALPDDLARLITQTVSVANSEGGLVSKRAEFLTARGRAEQSVIEASQLVSRMTNEVMGVSRRSLENTISESERLSYSVAEGKGTLIGIACFALLIFLVSQVLVSRSVVSPVRKLTETTRRLSSGKMDETPDLSGHGGEIAQLSEALARFRSELIGAEEMRETVEKEREKRAEEQKFVVGELAKALTALASGDLNCEIRSSFSGEYERLRCDFNQAIENLSQTVATIQDTSNKVADCGQTVSQSTGAMSRRAERNAASLEEIAAAIEQLTAAVKQADASMVSARALATQTSQSAETGREVANEAIAALDRIATSAETIKSTTSLIEEIAFQTHLLALNAGVEAARAGENGRGFAVVASEIGDLAQKSSEATKEISCRTRDLI